MKYFYSLLVLLLLSILIDSGQSQWIDKNPYTISETLASIHFINPMKGFAAGSNYIYKINPLYPIGFKKQFENSTKLNSITFPDSIYGFAVGYNNVMQSGIIAYSYNKGEDWTDENQILGNSKLYDVYFSNNNIGWVAGKYLDQNHAIIGKTSDGGNTFNPSTVPLIASGTFYAIYFVDEIIGWAVGSGDISGYGKIVKTTDGGENWFEIPATLSGKIKDVYFSDKYNGWICTDEGEILNSHDGGTSWDIQYSNNFTIHNLSFYNEHFGWATGDNGLIIKTTDGGLNWNSENCGTNEDLKAIASPYINVVWVCGNKGKLLTRETFTSAANLTPMIGTNLWGDYDSDGDLDVALSGVKVPDFTNQLQAIDCYSEIHKNNGDGTFSKIPDQLIKVSDGSLDWGDYDNDGDLDIVIAGFYEDEISSFFTSRIYRNDNNDNFTEVVSNLNGFDSGFIQWCDLDNDGDLDLVSTGGIYENLGDDVFTEMSSQIIGVKTGDLDSDGDLDIIGVSSDLLIYINEGNFSFNSITIPSNTKFTRKNNFIPESGNSMMEFYGSYDIGDYDSDGDLDILIINSNGTKVFRNDGNLNFTEPESIVLPKLSTGTGVFGDYDNDGDLDIFLTGGNTFNDFESGIYINEGNDIFTQLPFYYDDLQVISWASAHWGDYDNDGDLDLIVNGEAPQSNGKTSVYRNNFILANEAPTAPNNLSSVVEEYGVTLSWGKSFDSVTPQNGLQYNLVIGSKHDSLDILSPMSDITNGYRRIVTLGNTNQNNTWQLRNLNFGRYFWRVQSIDNSFAGSVFSLEGTFAIPYSIHNNVIPAGNTSPIVFDSSLVTIQFTDANSEDLDITIGRYDNLPEGVLPNNLQNISNTYWMIDANSGRIDGVYNLILDLDQIPGVIDYSAIHLLKRDDENSPWIDLGVPLNTGVSSAILWVGLTDFGQFGLGSGPENPLPVELSSFTALLENSIVKLSWTTETETNNYGFEIQRKIGNADWMKLAFIEGSGNSNSRRKYSYTDEYINGGSVFVYRLKQIDFDGHFEYSRIEEIKLNQLNFALFQNYPNPFNPSTKIRYQLPQESKVVIKVYDVLGSEVKELVNEKKESGIYEVIFNAENLPSGTYIYSLTSNNLIETKKMIFLK